MKILHLTLTKKWYDMIESGVKLEEYRATTPYWKARLEGKLYDAVQFRNGYRPESPTMLIALKNIWIGMGKQEWGAPIDKLVYIIELGANITE